MRLSILKGDIDAIKVSELSQTQLAPKRILELQERQKQNFFKEQVIINEPVALISKSKKGEELLVINPADMLMQKDDERMREFNTTAMP